MKIRSILDIPPNWNDIRNIADINKLSEIMEETVAFGIIEYECLSKKKELGKGGG